MRYAEQEERLRHMKEEAWELFGRQPSLRPRTREEFEEEFRRRVLSGVFSSSKEEQEKDLQKWLDELQKVAQVEERRLEAREVKRMGEEDAHSRSWSAWDKIFQQPIPNLFSGKAWSEC